MPRSRFPCPAEFRLPDGGSGPVRAEPANRLDGARLLGLRVAFWSVASENRECPVAKTS